jgi:hypothetical protein
LPAPTPEQREYAELLPNVEFEDDAETIAHDDALVPALESKNGSIEPFAQFLADLIQRSIESQA